MNIKRNILLNAGPSTTTDTVKWHRLYRISVRVKRICFYDEGFTRRFIKDGTCRPTAVYISFILWFRYIKH